MTLAIFDVDRTLLDGMSGALFAQYLWRERFLTWYGRWTIIKTMAGYRLGLLDDSAIVIAGVTCYQGYSSDDVAQMAKLAVTKLMVPRIYIEARKAIDFHLSAGRMVMLASGSSIFVVNALADFLGVQIAVGTSGKIDANGICLGEPKLPLCYQEGKLQLVQNAANKHDLKISDAYLYSDNFEDLALFKKVKHATAVNPSIKLESTAKTMNLKIEHWNQPCDPSYRVTGTSWPIKS